MALTSQKFEVVIQFIDTGGNTSLRTVQLQSADISTAETDAATVVTAYAAATDSKVLSYRVAEVFVEDAFSFPAGDVNVEEAAEVTVNIDGIPNKHAVFSIPAPKGTLFVGASGPNFNIVDGTDGLVTAIVDLYKAGNEAFISDGENVPATSPFLKGKRVHYRSRGG